MLEIKIPETELWDESKQEFYYVKEQTLCLEHSLVSLSKWESKWCKPFLAKVNRTQDETLDYVRCMTINQNVDTMTYRCISNDQMKRIIDYIEAPMTAIQFPKDKKGSSSGEQVTSELIYYWMIALNIPFECQKWHLNRLLNLIKVCNIKNAPAKKMSKRDLMNRNRSLNASRRKKLNSKG